MNHVVLWAGVVTSPGYIARVTGDPVHRLGIAMIATGTGDPWRDGDRDAV
jgi:hypothetical protein